MRRGWLISDWLVSDDDWCVVVSVVGLSDRDHGFAATNQFGGHSLQNMLGQNTAVPPVFDCHELALSIQVEGISAWNDERHVLAATGLVFDHQVNPRWSQARALFGTFDEDAELATVSVGNPMYLLHGFSVLVKRYETDKPYSKEPRHY